MASLIACINVIEKYFCTALPQKHRMVICNYQFFGNTLELGVPNSLIASTIWVTPGSCPRDQDAVQDVNAE